MKVVAKVMILTLVLPLLGCATSHQQPTDADKLRTFEDVYQAKWEKYAQHNFAPPRKTPYDKNPKLSEAYRKGYGEGVSDQLKTKGSGGVVDYITYLNNPTKQAHIEGYKAGTLEVNAKVGVPALDETKEYFDQYFKGR